LLLLLLLLLVDPSAHLILWRCKRKKEEVFSVVGVASAGSQINALLISKETEKKERK
jgi:hypothetical protein